MRTQRITSTPIPRSLLGRVSITVELVDSKEVPSYHHDMLAAANLSSVIFNYKDGSRVEYAAWEYECVWCGSYDHQQESCPELEDHGDDDINIA